MSSHARLQNACALSHLVYRIFLTRDVFTQIRDPSFIPPSLFLRCSPWLHCWIPWVSKQWRILEEKGRSSPTAGRQESSWQYEDWRSATLWDLQPALCAPLAQVWRCPSPEQRKVDPKGANLKKIKMSWDQIFLFVWLETVMRSQDPQWLLAADLVIGNSRKITWRIAETSDIIRCLAHVPGFS